MRIQEAVVRQLQQASTATYAIVGTRTYWNISAKDPVLPFNRVRKSGHDPISVGLQSRRLPAMATIEIVSYAKTQQEAAALAEAVESDLSGFTGDMPNTSPATAGAVHIHQIEPGTEEDLVSEEALSLNIYAEAREYLIRYR
jgi:hypothetical protein